MPDETIHAVDEPDVPERLRLAIDELRNDAAFVERLRQRRASERALYERLAN